MHSSSTFYVRFLFDLKRGMGSLWCPLWEIENILHPPCESTGDGFVQSRFPNQKLRVWMYKCFDNILKIECFKCLNIDFCYTWIPSLAHVHPNSILLDLAKHGFTIIWRSSKNMNFPKIWRLWLKNCARHTHFSFEFLKGMAVLFFEIYPWNFDHLWIFYRQKNDVLFIFLCLQ